MVQWSVGGWWRGGRFRMMAKVPPNSRGVVKMPGEEGVREVGSGVHEFEVGYEVEAKVAEVGFWGTVSALGGCE